MLVLFAKCARNPIIPHYVLGTRKINMLYLGSQSKIKKNRAIIISVSFPPFQLLFQHKHPNRSEVFLLQFFFSCLPVCG